MTLLMEMFIAFRDEDNSQHGKAIVGTVSGIILDLFVTFANVYNISATISTMIKWLLLIEMDLIWNIFYDCIWNQY